ncbi:RHS repeat-associated core domain-containing protein [Streptomyces alkaliterrae]|uniref:Rhs family-like protein n=4 Tax=Streptomyces alkaliterrae TaxID=2213162 RepID=A0A5P0YJH0_9ACTN|nr:RHS repeat-associated core domain-containing protein [Streptomyces alkaliterrae]MQS00524.1 Rhs family-like protein [Streptomyces alkaliterrae]
MIFWGGETVQQLLWHLKYLWHWRRSVTLVAFLAMLVTLLPQADIAAAAGRELPEVERERSVSGQDHKPRKNPAGKGAPAWRPGKNGWPTGSRVLAVDGSARDQVDGRAASTARPRPGDRPTPLLRDGGKGGTGAGLPVALTTPGASDSKDASKRKRGSERRRAARPGETARVEVLNRAAARRAGVEGLLFTLAPTTGGGLTPSGDDSPARGEVGVRVDYSGFDELYGGDWASRLRIVQLPACALTTPDKAACRTATPLPSENDPAEQTVTADVDLAPTTAKSSAVGARSFAAQPVVFAAAAGSSGSSGSYSATPLSPSGSWMAGSSSGGFSWTYPVETPEVPGGPQPEIALGYSSQSVDGRTASTNGQSSWVAEGWDYEPGFIERRYRSCADDQGNGANNTTKTGDLCWGSDQVIMSLGGSSTELVKDDTTGDWRPADDDGSRVERRTGAANGTKDGEHWVVTTTDGTRYHFGLNKLPGAPDDTVTNSVATAPVYGNHPGEPCHASTFAASSCTQGWRWNLDYVVDTHGDAMTLWWTKETNRYGAAGKDTGVAYTRATYLRRIDYGQRATSLFTGQPAGRVGFTVAERCVPTANFDCAVANRTPANATHWPDVPLDQECKSGASCKGKNSPTFWTTKRLTKISTSVLVGTALRTVDSWTLDQSFPATGDGTSPALWLKSLTRTGHAADGTTASMPPVTFEGIQLDNRVDGLEGLPPFSRWRVNAIRTETGGSIAVTYSDRDCRALAPKRMPADPHTNTYRCYPQYWTPEGAWEPVQDWFHKYVVTQVREEDNVTDAPPKVTSYEYLGGAAWAFDDSEFADDKHRTWSQYRGYERVRTRLGAGDDVKQLSEHRYFRGMHGDRLPSGTRTASVSDSEGNAVTDHGHFQGQLREEITYASDGGPVENATTFTSWAQKTASRKRAGTTPLDAYMVRPATNRSRERGDGDTWLRATETTTYDSYGMPTKVDEVTTGGTKRCTTTTYARNTAKHILDAEVREVTTAGACAETGATVLDDTRTLYDGQTYGKAPTTGLVTQVQERNAEGDGYVTTDRTEYDVHGRETATFDTEGGRTTVAYTPATGAIPTKTVTTDPLGHTETVEFDPLRGLPLAEIDANGKRVDLEYDPLGRLLKVWDIDRDKATQTPSATYEYSITKTAPTVVTTRAVRDNGSYSVSYEILDGLLRTRQVQDQAVGGGRLISDTFHDSAGRDFKSNDGYFNESAPSRTLLLVGDHQVPAQSRVTYNGLGEPTAEIAYFRGEEKHRTVIERTGNSTTTVPPGGDIVTTTFTDDEGRVAKLREYSNTARTKWRDTTYHYDALDQLVRITAPGGAETTFTYDGRGRQTSSTDPDGGTTRYTYDNSDRVVTTTDPRGNTLYTKYDVGGRPVSLHEDGPNGPKRLEWTYDTLGKGLPVAAIRHHNGEQYREEVTGYDKAYRPTGTRTVIPASEGLVGGTHNYRYSYTSTGNLSWVEVPGVGGLTTERIVFRYNADGLPISIGGTANYVTDVQYSAFGETLRVESGATGRKVWSSYEFDEFTKRLTKATFDRSVNPGRIDDVRYRYDEAGNVTSITSTPGQAVAADAKPDTQCFAYDQLRRMTSAWTAKTDCAGTPGKATVGGPDAYWHSYEFDEAGNRTKLVEHDTDGDAGKDVTRTYRYGKAGVGGPNALAEVLSTGPGGDRLNTFAYDKAGNTTKRQRGGTTQTLTWDIEGQLTKVSEPLEEGGTSETSYLYGPDGERLIRTAPDGKKTLYLGEAELTVDDRNGERTAQRFYEHPDGSTTVRSTGGGRELMLSDHHGTSNTTVDLVDPAMGVVRRQTMPFGEERGAAPTSWPGERGFVGGTIDRATGLTRLGARDYDPATGRFISVDPMVDYTEPATINPYAYANNAPATFSDPDGLFFPILVGIAARIALQAAIRAAARYAARRAAQAAARRAAQAAARRAAARAAARRAAARAAARRAAARRAAQRAAARAAARRAAARAAARRAAQRRAAAQARQRAARAAQRRAQAQRAAQRRAKPKPRPQPRSQPKPKPKPSQQKKPTQRKVENVKRELKEEARDNAIDTATNGGGNPGCNSFAPGTYVLMADGSKKPIDKIKVGDKVLATDPRTGRTETKTVTATILGEGRKQLVKVTVRTAELAAAAVSAGAAVTGGDGTSRALSVAADDRNPSDRGTASVVATDGHPFWVPQLGEWLKADELAPGQWLQTSSGTWVQITAVEQWTAKQRVHNLTVEGIHTYYVGAGPTTALVHNCNGSTWTPDENYSPEAIASRSEEWSRQAGLTKKHDQLAREVASNPSYPQRISGGALDFFRNSGNARGWSDWKNSPIFDMTGLGQHNQIRVMVHHRTGEIAWFPLKKSGEHDYNNPRYYKYGRRGR